jgi:polysaccharide export outer membrane protein
MTRILLILLFFCGFLTSVSAQALRPGDTLNISVWQDPKLDQKGVVVGPDGMIGFPLIGQVRAGGLTPSALQSVLAGRLKKNYQGDVDVTVSLAAVNKDEEDETKPRVYVTGEVLKPGPYTIKPRINVVQALALAGGIGPFAAAQRIQVHRKIKGVDSIFLFNYNAYQSGTDTVDNINLRAGDIIIVPERGLLE